MERYAIALSKSKNQTQEVIMAIKRGLGSLKLLVVGEAVPTNPTQPGQRSVLAQKAMTPDMNACMIEHPRGGLAVELKNGDVVNVTGIVDERTSLAPRSGREVKTLWVGDVIGAKVSGNIFEQPELAEAFATKTITAETWVIGGAPASAQSGSLAN
jgi:hypothetical protein